MFSASNPLDRLVNSAMAAETSRVHWGVRRSGLIERRLGPDAEGLGAANARNAAALSARGGGREAKTPDRRRPEEHLIVGHATMSKLEIPWQAEPTGRDPANRGADGRFALMPGP